LPKPGRGPPPTPLPSSCRVMVIILVASWAICSGPTDWNYCYGKHTAAGSYLAGCRPIVRWRPQVRPRPHIVIDDGCRDPSVFPRHVDWYGDSPPAATTGPGRPCGQTYLRAQTGCADVRFGKWSPHDNRIRSHTSRKLSTNEAMKTVSAAFSGAMLHQEDFKTL